MPALNHAIIYIPGLGDTVVTGQRLALKLWRLQGIRPYLFQMRWASDEPYENKMRRLVRLIDRLHAEGATVSLVGVSAGASAAVNAYAARPDIISGVGCICGKLTNAQTVSEATYRHNPPFAGSMERLPASLVALGPERRARILSLKPLADHTVPPADTYVEGSQVGTLPTIGHVVSIAYGLTFSSGRLIRFLKKQAIAATK